MKFTGQVLDTAGNPLYGASVYVLSNMGNGMSANTFGQFALNVNKGDVIRISFVGYYPIDIVAEDEKPVTVVLTNSGEIEGIEITAPRKPKSDSSLIWLLLVFGGAVVVSQMIGKDEPKSKKSEPKKVNV